VNIVVIGRFYVEAFGEHIAESLEAMGHRVTRYEAGIHERSSSGRLAKRIAQARRHVHALAERASVLGRLRRRRLLQTIEEAKPDLVLVSHDFLAPDAAAEVKRVARAPLALWYPDHIGLFARAYFLNAPYDVLFFKDPYIVSALSRTLRLNVHYLPECCNLRRHGPVELTAADHRRFGCQIATAGNLYPYRAAFFSRLSRFEVKIWGNPPPLWLDVSGVEAMLQNVYVANEEKAKAFAAAAIVVNNLNPAEIWGVNVRTFEAAAAGAFQLIDWRPGLAQLFENGREIVSFRSHDELMRGIEHFLAAPEERAAIARRGQARAAADHTYEKRLAALLDTVSGRGSGFPMPESPY
jgi:spore maturation protein CgeB